MTYVDWFSDGTLAVAELGLACCAAEYEAAAAGRPRLAAVPAGARVVLVVSGTLTRPVVPRLQALAAELGDPPVVALGACASAGGPYWDSPVVVRVDEVVPVAAYVPGCAPVPAALTEALETLREAA